MSTLERETATYRALLPDLLARRGEYAVIKGDHLVGVFPDYEAALTAGYTEYLDEAFLVRLIEAEPRVHSYTRDIALECRP